MQTMRHASIADGDIVVAATALTPVCFPEGKHKFLSAQT